MKKRTHNQMGYGALISYLLVIGNALFGVFVTPFILKYLGISSYGVYKTVGSLSSSLLILDLGIGGTLIRYISKYRANDENDKVDSFASMMLCECFILIPFIVLIECFLYSNMDYIYGSKLLNSELLLAKQIFVVLSINIVFTIIEHFMNGIISGFNDFIFAKGIKLLSLFSRISLILVLIPITKSALFLVLINLGLMILVVLCEVLFIVINYKLHFSFDLRNWDWGLFKESFVYMLLIFLTSIAAQINNNLDNVIIGSFCGTAQVTVYSFGLLIFSMFEQLSTSISGVALPTVSRIIVEENWKQKVQDFVIKLGRIQFMLLGAATIGFIVLGQEFLLLWLGEGFNDVYWIVLILIVPALFELCVNVCLAVLRAKNMLLFRTIVLVSSTVLNFIVSIAMINQIGYFSAAIGTAASFIVGSLIVMNVYYYKKLKFNMVKIYARILHKTLVCLLLTGLLVKLLSYFIYGTWFSLIGKIIVFIIVFFVMMMLWGFTNEERQFVNVRINKS